MTEISPANKNSLYTRTTNSGSRLPKTPKYFNGAAAKQLPQSGMYPFRFTIEIHHDGFLRKV